MVANVFVLGRSGSGKSTAIRHMIKLASRRGYLAKYRRDYPILREMYNNDVEHKRFVPAPFKGFDVTDFNVLDEALEQLEGQIQKVEQETSGQKEIIFIEFARNDYYHALNNFDAEILQKAYFLFIESDLETCIERIHQRCSDSSLEEDCHFVSDFIMKSYFSTDNWLFTTQTLLSETQAHQRIQEVTNDGSLEEFHKQVSNFAETVFQEFYNNQTSTNESKEEAIPIAL